MNFLMENAATILNVVDVLVAVDVVFGIVAFISNRDITENGVIDN